MQVAHQGRRGQHEQTDAQAPDLRRADHIGLEAHGDRHEDEPHEDQKPLVSLAPRLEGREQESLGGRRLHDRTILAKAHVPGASHLSCSNELTCRPASPAARSRACKLSNSCPPAPTSRPRSTPSPPTPRTPAPATSSARPGSTRCPSWPAT